MSLINEMLHDLETRRGGEMPRRGGVLDGLRPAPARRVRPARPAGVWTALLLAAVAATGAWHGRGLIERFDTRSAPAGVSPAATPSAQTAAAPQSTLPEPAARGAAATHLEVSPAIPSGDGTQTLDGTAPASLPPPAMARAPAPGTAFQRQDHDETAPGDLVAGLLAVAPPWAAAGAATREQPLVAALPPEREAYPIDEAPWQSETPAIHKTPRAPGGPGPVRTAADAPIRALDVVPPPTDPVVLCEQRARALIERGADDEARAVLRAGLRESPGASRLAWLLAQVLVEHDDARGALAALEASPPALAADPAYHAFIAALAQRLGEHARAAAIYRQVLEQAPARGVWWVGLAISLAAGGQREAALEAYLRARADATLAAGLRAYADAEIARLRPSRS